MTRRRFVGDAGWSNGDARRADLSSIFRLHFGHFVRPAHAGRLHSARRRALHRDCDRHEYLAPASSASWPPGGIAQRLWTTTIWGTPLAMAFSALADVSRTSMARWCSGWVLLALLVAPAGGSAMCRAGRIDCDGRSLSSAQESWLRTPSDSAGTPLTSVPAGQLSWLALAGERPLMALAGSAMASARTRVLRPRPGDPAVARTANPLPDRRAPVFLPPSRRPPCRIRAGEMAEWSKAHPC